jgi:hypothetical protein
VKARALPNILFRYGNAVIEQELPGACGTARKRMLLRNHPRRRGANQIRRHWSRSTLRFRCGPKLNKKERHRVVEASARIRTIAEISTIWGRQARVVRAIVLAPEGERAVVGNEPVALDLPSSADDPGRHCADNSCDEPGVRDGGCRALQGGGVGSAGALRIVQGESLQSARDRHRRQNEKLGGGRSHTESIAPPPTAAESACGRLTVVAVRHVSRPGAPSRTGRPPATGRGPAPDESRPSPFIRCFPLRRPRSRSP